jgi:hypothetical protein
MAEGGYHTSATRCISISNIALGLGVLGVAAGATIVLTAPRGTSPTRTTLIVAPRDGGGALQAARTF